MSRVRVPDSLNRFGGFTAHLIYDSMIGKLHRETFFNRNKRKEDTAHKRSTETSPQAGAQSLTLLKQKLLVGEHSDSDEATNASLARERPQEKSKDQTFQRNRMRHTYSPGR